MSGQQPQRDPLDEAAEQALRELQAEEQAARSAAGSPAVLGAFSPSPLTRGRAFKIVERRVRQLAVQRYAPVPAFPLGGGLDAQDQWEACVFPLIVAVRENLSPGIMFDHDDALAWITERARTRAQEYADRDVAQAREAERRAKLDRQLALIGVPFRLSGDQVRDTYGDDPELARAHLQQRAKEEELERVRQGEGQRELRRQHQLNDAWTRRQVHQQNYEAVMFRVWPFVRFGGLFAAGLGAGSSVGKRHGPLLGGLAGLGAALGWMVGCSWLEGAILTTPEVGAAVLRGGVQAVLPKPLGGAAAAGIQAAAAAAPAPVSIYVQGGTVEPPLERGSNWTPRVHRGGHE